MKTLFHKSLLFLTILVTIKSRDLCPNNCLCRRINQRQELRVRCGESTKIQSLNEIEFLGIANDLVQLNLSNNLLEAFLPLVRFTVLQKLDLSDNKLNAVENNQFSELPNLRRLDLSNNNIKNIELQAFANLVKLERLKLNQNQISSITHGTLDSLISLKQMDLSNNPLRCDCGLLWLLEWSTKASVKLVSNPTCHAPLSFKGSLLRKLKVGTDIHCLSSVVANGVPILKLNPDVNQVVFEGDSLQLSCTAPSTSDSYEQHLSSTLEWTWLDSDPKMYFSNITIDNVMQNTGHISSNVWISNLTKHHTGIWNCVFTSVQGNYSKEIMIIVISDDTEYCPISYTSNNKGTYTWPRTVVNYTASLPCESINLNWNVTIQKATYYCTEEGQWENLNTSVCPYISETTKIFEQFSKVNSSIVESAKHFRNYTSSIKHFKDIMDIVFAVQTMENYLKYLTVNQIGGILFDVINNMLQLSKTYLKTANYQHHICTKLIKIVEDLAVFSTTSLFHKSNLAVETFPVQQGGFSNLKCTWYIDIEKTAEPLFYCVADSHQSIIQMPGKIVFASITIPATLFEQLDEQGYQLSDKIYNILISMYVANAFFPIDAKRDGKTDITSAVIGVKLDHFTVLNLTDPVFVMLKIPTMFPSQRESLVPVWWNPSSYNGTGSWSVEGCEFSNELQDHMAFYCYNFGYYGLMQNVTSLESSIIGEQFKLCHPALYVGSFILFNSLVVLILTYLFCYNVIQMPKKTKHCFINLWISVSLLCFLYVFGVHQTVNVKICQFVGLLLHYFTLTSLLWVCVGVNTLYKRLTKNEVLALQDDDLPLDQPIKKPIIGLYFVGYGVGTIVCGLSAAINISDYASVNYCFLKVGPPLSALYVPVAILITFIILFCFLIRCAITNTETNGQLSEGTQATENLDLDLLEPNFNNSELRSVLSSSSKTVSSETEDQEQTPYAHLKAYIIFLMLYILCWISCALATVENSFVYFGNDLFSILYAILAFLLSAFTIFFYGIARSDVRSQWILVNHCVQRKQLCFRSRNISDTTENVPHIQIQPLPFPPTCNATNGEAQLTSRCSSRTSSRTKSNSHMSNILKSAADLNGPPSSDSQLGKINNVNLVTLHRQQYRTNLIPNIIENPTNAAEVFYNPQQSVVARKFFKKQKRHMMKRNNLVPRVPDSDSASVLSNLKPSKGIEQTIFGTSSKVNNTNLHVEHVQRNRQKNPNIFTDSADDCECVKNIVLNAERLRSRETSKHRTKKKMNTPLKPPTTDHTMRSVSQQCTLEYSSENISDSILDRTSPLKDLSKNIDPLSSNVHLELDDSLNYVNNSKMQNDITPAFADSKFELSGPVSQIYINPSHDLDLLRTGGIHSRGSSLSVSDLDELYQQISRGPKMTVPAAAHNFTRNSPCFSDSDITLSFHHAAPDQAVTVSKENLRDNIETRV